MFDECDGTATNKNYMNGGSEQDDLWYVWDGSCDSNSVLDASSTCGADSDLFGQVTGSQTLLSDCEGTLALAPSCSLAFGESPPTPPQD